MPAKRKQYKSVSFLDLCQECGPKTGKRGYKLGLCNKCYHDKKIRRKHNSPYRMGQRPGKGQDFNGEAKRPVPKAFAHGTEEEVKILQHRLKKRHSLYTPLDKISAEARGVDIDKEPRHGEIISEAEVAIRTSVRGASVARKVNLFRRERKLSQEQLAQASGLSFHTIQSYELGRRVPHFTSIPSLAKALKIPVEVLLS